MIYTPEQIKVGKRLVAWLISTGCPRELARAETSGILKRHTVKRIIWGFQQTCCTSLSNLKKIL